MTDHRTIRLVLDTNVYVAASSPRSYIAKFVFATKESLNPYEVYISPQILVEVQAKLVVRIKYTQEEAISFLRLLQAVTNMVYPKRQIRAVERDPDDNKILECAVEAKADMVVTADRDLLELKIFEGIAMVHPSQLKYIFADVFS